VGVYDRAAPILASLMARQGHAHLIPTEVTVWAGGRVITRTSNTGDADWHDHHAAEDGEALDTKFRRFCEPYLSAQAIEQATRLVAQIDTAPEVRSLVITLVAGTPSPVGVAAVERAAADFTEAALERYH
jgi:hypothetical protein